MKFVDLAERYVASSKRAEAGNANAIRYLSELDGKLADEMDELRNARAEIALEMGRHAKAHTKANRTALGIELVSTAPKKRYDNTRAASGIGAYLSEHPAIVGDTADPETGELIPVPRSVAVQRAVRTALELAGATVPSFTGWRTKSAAAIGLDVSRYEDTEREADSPSDTPPKARVVRRATAPSTETT